MAGCSKKQYAILMSAGAEGKKLASEMGGMEQDAFDKAFSELMDSDSYKPSEGESKYNRDEDEDYKEFDENNDEDFGFDEDAHMDYEEVFTDNDTAQIERYAKHYGVDVEELKDAVHQNALERIRQGDSVTNAKNDAMEEELDRLDPGSKPVDEESSPMNEFSGPDKEGPSYAQLDKFNELYDSIEGAGREEMENELQYKVQEAFEKGEISNEQYNELFDKMDKVLLYDSEVEKETQENLDKSNFVMNDKGQAEPAVTRYAKDFERMTGRKLEKPISEVNMDDFNSDDDYFDWLRTLDNNGLKEHLKFKLNLKTFGEDKTPKYPSGMTDVFTEHLESEYDKGEPRETKPNPNEERRTFALRHFLANLKPGQVYDLVNPANGNVGNTFEILNKNDESVTFKDKTGETKTLPSKEFAQMAAGSRLR